MKGLIKDNATFKLHARIATSFKDASFLPFVVDAQSKYIRRYLGDTLLNALDDYYNTTPQTADTALDALLPFVQNAIAKFTLAIGGPSFDILLTESGFAVTSNTNLAPASKERVQNFINSMIQLGYDEIEVMLRFLETNKSDYSSWVQSSAYTEFTENFISKADDFDKIIRIDNSRLKFMELKPLMDMVEMLRIEPVISVELATEIKQEIVDDAVSVENKKILKNLKWAIAHFTYFEYTKNKRNEELGNSYLAEVKKVIDTTPDFYPLYRDSPCYDDTKTSYNNYENTENSSIFNMGAL